MFLSLWNQPMFKTSQAFSVHAVVVQSFDEPDFTSLSLSITSEAQLHTRGKRTSEFLRWQPALTSAISKLKSTSLNLEEPGLSLTSNVWNIASGYILIALNSDSHLTVSYFNCAKFRFPSLQFHVFSLLFFLEDRHHCFSIQQIWVAQSSI